MTAIVVSFLYMVLLIPYLAGIGAEHFRSGWFLGAVVIALTWIPLVWFHRDFKQRDGVLHLVLSVAPLMLLVTFFGALVAAAGATHCRPLSTHSGHWNNLRWQGDDV